MDTEQSEQQKKPERKRRNRWDDDSNLDEDKKLANAQEESKVETNSANKSSDEIVKPVEDEETTKKIRKSRFSKAGSMIHTGTQLAVEPPKLNLLSQEIVQQTVILKLQLQQINEKLVTVVQDALAIEQDPNRSPSPPPKYDSQGKRTNTREIRMREQLNQERIATIERMMKLNPAFQPPPDFIKGKPVRRIYIPKSNNPLYNYIGLIIGPRGHTQKQMEQETGCKISIRGKGSQKEGSKGRAGKNLDEDDELHVHIMGDDEERVERAAKMVQDILSPEEEELNLHKQKQLRELALINGTLREDEYCPVCGEKGHRQFECPYRAKTFKAAGVKCSICGDLSHPTRDCPMKEENGNSEVVLDNEYDSFMAELSGEKAASDPNISLTESEDGNNGSNVMTNSTASKVLNFNGRTTLVAPIVDIMSNSKRKNQTIIQVTTVMTGSMPASYFTTPSPTNTSTPSVAPDFFMGDATNMMPGYGYPVGGDTSYMYPPNVAPMQQPTWNSMGPPMAPYQLGMPGMPLPPGMPMMPPGMPMMPPGMPMMPPGMPMMPPGMSMMPPQPLPPFNPQNYMKR